MKKFVVIIITENMQTSTEKQTGRQTVRLSKRQTSPSELESLSLE